MSFGVHDKELCPAMKSIMGVSLRINLAHPSSFKWKVGNVMSVLFWSDFWWHNSSMATLFPILFLLASDKESKLCDMVHLLNGNGNHDHEL